MRATESTIQFVAPAGTPMAGQPIGVDLMLAIAVAKVVRDRPALLPELHKMQKLGNTRA